MLTPEYLDSLTDDILGMYDALNESIISDIARRIVKTGMVTETAAWQAKQMMEMGLLHDDVIQRVAEVTGYTEKELQRLFEEAGVENIRYENDIMSMAGLMPIQLKQSESMMKLLKAGLEKTGKDLSNLTLTTALRAQSSYYNAVNLAYMQVSGGVLSYQEAVKRAILSTAKEGSSVLYPSGHTDKIDVAVRRSVLTGVNQTAAQMSLTYCEETGCDFVETTAHSGARPSHEVWQGKVFCISGNSSEYPPFSETGYGTGAGLCGWNCRHSFHAFFPGISVPAYTKEMLEDYRTKKYEYDGKKLTDYECSQIQRSYEREIRETRRQLTACDAAMKETDDEVLKVGLQMEFADKSVQLKEQEGQLKAFCKQTNRRVDSSRLQVHAVRDGKGRIISFNKSVSQKAVYENKVKDIRRDTREYIEYKNVIGDSIGSLAEFRQMKYNDSERFNLLSDYTNSVKNGMISKLSGFDNYKALHTKIKNEIIGIKTVDGITITGQSKHFLERVIGTMQDPKTNRPRSGVDIEDIKEALLKGTVRTSARDPNSVKYVTDKCIVSLNLQTGNLIQCNPQ